MKDQYFGDVNDYRKYGLLRALLRGNDLRLLVGWMLTPDDGTSDGGRRAYLEDGAWRRHDPWLYDSLRAQLSGATPPRVAMAAEAELLPRASYFAAPVQDSVETRLVWFEALCEAAAGADFVFLDPDNGLPVRSVAPGRRGSGKYAQWREVERLAAAGKSLLVYQHFPREPRAFYVARRVQEIAAHTGASTVWSFATSSVLFLLAAQPAHEGAFRAAAQSNLGAWQGQFQILETRTAMEPPLQPAFDSAASGPNILLLHSDQHRYDCLGANGHPFIQTPNLDQLAADGARFTHAFTPSPVCVPARNSLLFGCWPATHGVVANSGTEAEKPPRAGLTAFSQALSAAGYWLGMVGKWGIDRELKPADFGFDAYVSHGGYGAWRAEQGIAPQPHTNGWFGEADPYASPEQTRLGWGADRTIDLLTTAAAGDQPFFIRWDTEEPHLPCIPCEPFASAYPPETIPPWPSFGDTFEGKPYIQAQQLRTWGLDGWTWEQWAPVVSRYMGVISLLDSQIGRVLAALERLGLAENTLVVYTCDHGDTCGGHGMIDKHFVLYDDLLRLPFVARWPGHIVPGTVCDEMVVSGLDLAATFVDVAGAERPASFEGTSLLTTLAEGSGREDVYATYVGSQFGLFSQRSVRDRRYKYVWNAVAEDELYDLDADPGELTNRGTDPALAGELARLRGRLLAWFEQTRDPLLNGWIREQLTLGRKV